MLAVSNEVLLATLLTVLFVAHIVTSNTRVLISLWITALLVLIVNALFNMRVEQIDGLVGDRSPTLFLGSYIQGYIGFLISFIALAIFLRSPKDKRIIAIAAAPVYFIINLITRAA